MLVRDLGEFGLIELLTDTLVEENVEGPEFTGDDLQSPHLGIGDDAAVWEGKAGTRVLTTDTMVEVSTSVLGLTAGATSAGRRWPST